MATGRRTRLHKLWDDRCGREARLGAACERTAGVTLLDVWTLLHYTSAEALDFLRLDVRFAKNTARCRDGLGPSARGVGLKASLPDKGTNKERARMVGTSGQCPRRAICKPQRWCSAILARIQRSVETGVCRSLVLARGPGTACCRTWTKQCTWVSRSQPSGASLC